jgi:hypothetical protein
MAVMKGILDVVTILPDSIGWKQNLGPEGLQERMLENLGWLYNFQILIIHSLIKNEINKLMNK